MERAMNYAHQAGIFDPKYASKTILIGAGSVGSMVALYLAKMGVTDLEVWDADIVASHNCPMSLYGPQDVGLLKVDALAGIIKRLTGTEIKTQRKMYTDESFRNVSVVACVDTMAARKAIWGKLKHSPTVEVFCDTRTAGTYLEVLCVVPCDPQDIESYEAMLFDDSKAARQTCGNHGIIYTAACAAYMIASSLASFWEQGKKEFRVAEQTLTLGRIVGPADER